LVRVKLVNLSGNAAVFGLILSGGASGGMPALVLSEIVRSRRLAAFHSHAATTLKKRSFSEILQFQIFRKTKH
jgi:hypothetical protein